MKNKIVGTVIGGLIVAIVSALFLDSIPKPRDLLAKVASVVWGGVNWLFDALASSHSMPGWAILFMGILALFGLIVLCILVVSLLAKGSPRSEQEHSHINYREDTLDGLKWRWRWEGDRITDLWCFCPSCDAQLVYQEGFAETEFICENCPSDGSMNPYRPRGRVVGTIHGGDKRYASGAIQREIFRRIRTGDR